MLSGSFGCRWLHLSQSGGYLLPQRSTGLFARVQTKNIFLNAKRMMVNTTFSTKLKVFHVGDLVTVRIPCIDRTSIDPPK